MKAYYLTFPGLYVGGHAVVVARSAFHAKTLLLAKTEENMMPIKREEIGHKQIDTQASGVAAFNDGDY